MGGADTQTKQSQALDRMAAFGGFQCPACGAPLVAMEACLRCEKGHTYDVARKGYVHLHHKTVSGFYDKTLFRARRAVFEAGFYLPVIQALAEVLIPLSPRALLDAGCGEGYYLSALSPMLPETFLAGLDLSKEAIQSAAARGGPMVYCVGTLNRLPFADHTFDAVLNILSPASYESFARVLRKDGLLIKIMPGSLYLNEIRERLGAVKPYDDTLTPAYLARHMRVLRTERLTYARPVSPEEYACFIVMTPLTEGMDPREKEALALAPPKSITIDLHMAVCRPAL